MESTQELKHYGIKGQKWGIRRYENPDGTLTEAGKKRYRYQNPDGSLTEEGKKDYMTAAKKGKLDLSKLSNQDLDMINARFAKENTYKQNVQKYEDSKFSNQLKKAVIDRVRGNGGGGNNSKGKGKSKGGIASLLAMPIKKAFEDAFKDDGKSGGGNSDKEKQNPKPKAEEDDEVRRGFKLGRHFARYGYKESDELRESRIKNGKRFLEGSLPLSMGPNRTAEDVVRERRTRRAVRENDEWWRNSMESPDSWGWSSMRFDTSEYLMHGASQYAISRSDELYHHGIKGQRWGIRRYQNPDGTLTEVGRQRYMYDFGSGRKMSLVGRLKFSKDVRQKTEADEAQKFKKHKDFIDNIDSRSAEMKTKMNKYDKMDQESKKKFGNEVLDEISSCDKWFSEENDYNTAKWESVENYQDTLNNWISKQVKTKSGETWNNKSVSEGHRKALDEYNKAESYYLKTDKNIDSVYNAGHKLVSVGLRDIGFEDTFENRKRCWQYFFEDYYPWYSYDYTIQKHKSK